MIRQREAEFARDLLLEAFNFTVLEFHDLGAHGTGEVVVVLFRGPFVSRRHAAHPHFRDKLMVRESSQKPINSCESDRGILRGHGFVNFLSREVAWPSADHVQYQESLRCHFEAQIADDLFVRNLFGSDRSTAKRGLCFADRE